MKYQELMKGYKKILTTIYSQKEYYERVKTFLQEYELPRMATPKVTRDDIKAFFRAIWKLGILENGKRYYWKLLAFSLFHHPRKLPVAITMAIYGFHFRRVVQSV